MEKEIMRVGIIGAGAISDIYLKNMIHEFDQLQVIAIASTSIENAKKKADEYGIEACTVDEILSNPQIDMVVNLTPVGAHYELIRASLLAGKHVYTEKTITDDVEKARELLELANEKKLYLGSAPDTFLGAAWQTARMAIDEGTLGEIHSFAISGNRNNDLLLSIFAFLRQPGAGIVCDYGVYYLTALVSLLGPVARVGGIVGRPYPTHRNIMPMSPEFGKIMDTPNESQVSAVLQLKNGICGTLHIDADNNSMDNAFFAIYGTKGILYLTDPNQFGGSVKFLPNSMDPRNPVKPIELLNFSKYDGNSRGIGPAEMADAIFQGCKNRASKEMAYHVLEVLAGILQGGDKGSFINITSTFDIPLPMPMRKVDIKNIGHISFNAKDMNAMLHFYGDILGMKRQFTLTLGELCESLKKQYGENITSEQQGILQALGSIGKKPWIEYLKLADGQFIELFHDLGHTTRTIENRSENYGFTKFNYEVTDIVELRDHFVKEGIKIDADIHITPDGSKEIVVHDPDGNEVQFTEYSKDESAFIKLTPDSNHTVCSRVCYTTQIAFQVKDSINMEHFYCKGLGLNKVMTLTYEDLSKTLEGSGQVDERTLMGLKMMGNKPWIDYIEVAPHQYIEFFHTDGQNKNEDRNLQDAYGYQHICLEVPNIQDAWNAVIANGMKPDTEISLGSDGSYQFWLVDPDGNRLELMEYAPGAKQLL